MSEPTGRVERIWIKRFHGGPMDETDHAVLKAGQGMEGNANQGGKRQVTVIALERWQRVESELGTKLDPSLRRANVLVSGVELANTRGRILRVGDVRLHIHGETRPCHLMDEQHDGLQTALDADWGGGAYAEVLDDGEVRPGDGADWES